MICTWNLRQWQASLAEEEAAAAQVVAARRQARVAEQQAAWEAKEVWVFIGYRTALLPCTADIYLCIIHAPVCKAWVVVHVLMHA